SMRASVQTSNQSNQVIQIEVQDTGIGMKEDELERVFIEFEQFETKSSNNISGTGLGLAITKRLVELHDGKIEIESQKDKGTTVKVLMNKEKTELPIAKKGTKKKQIKELPFKSVVVADDELYNRRLVKALLDGYDLKIYEAENGQECIELISKQAI